MMEVYTAPPTHVGLFKKDRFDPACKMENAKFFEDQPELIENGPIECRNWSFTEYPPERVTHLYHNWQKCFAAPQVHPGVKEAYGQGLSLLEVCMGDYGNPRYIAVVPGLDVEALKKQWRRDYYRFHHPTPMNILDRGNAGNNTSAAAQKGENSQ